MANPIDAALAALDAAGVELPLCISKLREDCIASGEIYEDGEAATVAVTFQRPERDLIIAAVNALPEVRRMRKELDELRENSKAWVERAVDAEERLRLHAGDTLSLSNEIATRVEESDRLRERVNELESSLKTEMDDSSLLVNHHADVIVEVEAVENALNTYVDRLAARVSKLEDALLEAYGLHAPTCSFYMEDPKDCTCGVDELLGLAALAPAPAKAEVE